MHRIFLDCEFTALTQSAELLSLALVAEHGQAFYAVFEDNLRAESSDFVRQEVLGNIYELPSVDLYIQTCYGGKEQIVAALRKWLSRWEEASCRVWADVLAYDWVLFCELFGGAEHIPEQLHYIPLDLATLLELRGFDPDRTRSELIDDEEFSADFKGHNALYDAILGMKLLQTLA